MKKLFSLITLFSIFITILFFGAPDKTFAYTGGILNGKTFLIYDKNLFYTGTTTAAITDNNESTIYTLSKLSAGFSIVEYEFPVVAQIDSYKIRSVNTRTSFFNSAHVLMAYYDDINTSVTGAITKNVGLVGVKYVQIRNMTDTATRAIYEFDVFGTGGEATPTPTPIPTPTPDTTPPANVLGLTNFVGLSIATLYFTTPSDSDFSQYKIYQDGSLIYTSAVGTTKSSPFSYTASSLFPSTTYLYKVTTIDSAGNESLGVTTSATTLTPDTTPPANVTALLVTNIAYTTAVLDFVTPADSDFSRYKIYQNGSLIYNSIPGIQKNYLTSYPLSGLTASTVYSFKVTTVDTTGNESIGQSVSLTTLTPDLTAPAVPSNLVITGANGSANFTWNAVSDIDLKGYFYTKIDFFFEIFTYFKVGFLKNGAKKPSLYWF